MWTWKKQSRLSISFKPPPSPTPHLGNRLPLCSHSLGSNDHQHITKYIMKTLSQKDGPNDILCIVRLLLPKQFSKMSISVIPISHRRGRTTEAIITLRIEQGLQSLPVLPGPQHPRSLQLQLHQGLCASHKLVCRCRAQSLHNKAKGSADTGRQFSASLLHSIRKGAQGGMRTCQSSTQPRPGAL